MGVPVLDVFHSVAVLGAVIDGCKPPFFKLQFSPSTRTVSRPFRPSPGLRVPPLSPEDSYIIPYRILTKNAVKYTFLGYIGVEKTALSKKRTNVLYG